MSDKPPCTARTALRMRSAKQVMLLEVVVLEGDGNEDSIMRLVTYFYRPNGELAAKRDAIFEQATGGDPR